ncbi:DNA polymerase alpha subunit B-like isoform X1 [Heliangelus exortis]|uniref:DNA polymerase alpha subunit B-like isoform X1 n=1 Tax=Heliangelus exortis TaxID=472823 RepID=UPI003A8D29C6
MAEREEAAAEAVSAEAVLRELGLFELRCQGEDVSARLVELCLTHGLGPVALANELLAFVTSKNLDTQLSTDVLDAFEHEVSKGCPPTSPLTPKSSGKRRGTLRLLLFPPPGPLQARQQSPPQEGRPLRCLPRHPLPPGAVSHGIWGDPWKKRGC